MSENSSVAVRDPHAVMEAVITKGDLSKLTAEERWLYYSETCRSIGLNPLTKPFDYLTLSGKTVLYATKACTDQLRSLRGISVTRVDARTEGDMRVVEVYATDADGRQDMDMGVVQVKNLTGDALANAYMKALTKAKRRVTLSLCGLGMLDESEVETIPGAVPAAFPAIDVESRETPSRITASIEPGHARARSENPRLYESLQERARAATRDADNPAWVKLVDEVGKDVALWPALIAEAGTPEHLAWLERKANGKGQALKGHFDRRRDELAALVEAGDTEPVVERDPVTGEVIPDHVGRS